MARRRIVPIGKHSKKHLAKEKLLTRNKRETKIFEMGMATGVAKFLEYLRQTAGESGALTIAWTQEGLFIYPQINKKLLKKQESFKLKVH